MNTVRVLYPDLLTENEPAEIISTGDDLNITVFDDQRSEVEVESGDGSVTITGSQFADTITGGAGNDSISGGDGNDSISGGDGDDVLSVGSGDTVSSGDGNDVFQFDLSQGLDIANTPTILDLQPEDKITILNAQDSAEGPVYDRNTGVLLLGDQKLVDIGQDVDLSTLQIDINPDDTDDTDKPKPFISQINSAEITVYRFYNPSKGAHFYTVDKVEKDYVLENLDNYTYEGESYSTIDPITGSQIEEVYRFFNSSTGVHLYTTSEIERDSIIETLDNFSYEGVKFYAHETQVEGTMPVYRFYEPSLGVHFYTPNEVEKDSVIENLDNYNFEGVAYYVEPLPGDM